MRIFYSPDYVGAGFSFDTTRKAEWIADSLSESPIPGVELIEPEPLIRSQVTVVHAAAFVRAVETGAPQDLAESQGFQWDAGLYPMVLASNGGVVAAAFAALDDGVSGSLSSGLHHARRDRGAGFCTFNGLVIAAKAALESRASSVLILDLDAHCGGGTASLISGESGIRQVDVSVDSFDSYRSSGRSALTMVGDSTEYLSTVERVLNGLETSGSAFDLCLYNAGMDPFERCTTGGLTGISMQILAAREKLVFDWCAALRLPIAFVLAGGYIGTRLDLIGLVELHRLTLQAASVSAQSGRGNR